MSSYRLLKSGFFVLSCLGLLLCISGEFGKQRAPHSRVEVFHIGDLQDTQQWGVNPSPLEFALDDSRNCSSALQSLRLKNVPRNDSHLAGKFSRIISSPSGTATIHLNGRDPELFVTRLLI